VLLAVLAAMGARTAFADAIAPGAAGAGVLDVPAIAASAPAHVLLDAAAVAGSRVVAGGEHGVIILSDDDGVTWRQAEVPVSATITGLSFADARIGYATGHFGTVLRTDDGGEHWRLLLDGRAVPDLMRVAAGDDAHAARLAARFASDGPDKPFLFACIVAPDHVQVFGASGMAVETEDGGTHWSDISRRIENPDGLNFYGLARQPDGSVLIAGEQGLLLSGDPATGLHKLASPYNGSYFGVLRLADGRLLTYGLVGHAFLSADEGAHWSPVATERPITLSAAEQTSDGTALLADGQGQIWRLAGDGGAAALAPSGIRAPWPVIALAETPSHAVLALGLGGVLRLPAQSATGTQDRGQ